MSNEEIVKKIYEALNSNDVSAYLSFFDEKIDRNETFGGRYHGLAELEDNFSQGRDTWAEGNCSPEKLTVMGNKVVVFVHVKVRQKGKTEWNEGDVVDIFTFQGSKVVEFYSFTDREEALKWAVEVPIKY